MSVPSPAGALPAKPELDSASSPAWLLFNQAVDLDEPAREELLARSCAQDPALLVSVRQLLQLDRRLAGSTVQPVADALARLAPDALPGRGLTGRRLGPFELREELGLGGMGVVYRAERVDGSVQQQVAIKFVRRELLNDDSRRRFQAERQTLAALDHPHIARLLDAAELDDGSPYLVMEFVAGTRITDYCDRQRLDLRARIRLLRLVCAAVAHAHRNLIVHRDLKPANLLVTADGTPKLLDFGIAKALGDDPGAALQTSTAQRYFSPWYAAPEQLLGATVGIGCDIYALGLLLYEVLTGTPPFDFTGLTAAQIERLVTSVPPAPPSATVTRHATAQVPSRALRGDLDHIVLRCLRKEPSERYASVEQLDADLSHWLDGRPVSVRAGHRWYRLRKFLQRNLYAVAAGVLVVSSLLGGMLASTWQARIAQQRADELAQVSRFQARMLEELDPTEAGAQLGSKLRGRLEAALAKSGLTAAQQRDRMAHFEQDWASINATDTAREWIDDVILQPAEAAIDTDFGTQPLVAASLQQVLAVQYRRLGMFDAAERLQEQAYKARAALLGPAHPLTMDSLREEAALLQVRGEYPQALAAWRRAHAQAEAEFGDHHPLTLLALNNIALCQFNLGQLEESEALGRHVAAQREQALGRQHGDTLTTKNNLALTLVARGNLVEAESVQKDVLEGRRQLSGPMHPLTLAAMHNLSLVYYKQGRLDEAEALTKQCLEARRKVLGEFHPDTLSTLNSAGALLHARGDLRGAETYLREAVQVSRRIVGAEHARTLNAIHNLAAVLERLRKYDEAETLRRALLDSGRRVLGAAHPSTLLYGDSLGTLLKTQGKLEAAEPFVRAGYAGFREVLGADHPDTLRSMIRMAALQNARGQYAAAQALLAPAEAKVRAAFAGPAFKTTAKYLLQLGIALTGTAAFAEAELRLEEAQGFYGANAESNLADARESVAALAVLYRTWQSAARERGHATALQRWQQALRAFDLAHPDARP